MFKELCQNFYTITFAIEVDRSRVLEGKPWLFDNYLLALKSLDSTIQPKSMSFNSEVFWVQMHDLPIMCMNRFNGSLIGNVIGSVLDVELKVDDTVGAPS